MEIFEDHYRILQVHHEASHEVIDAAYKRLCKIYHPDLNKDAHSNDRMSVINNSYEIVGNKELRKLFHDEWIKAQKMHGISSTTIPGQDDAFMVLNEYFQNLMVGNWKDAYLKLTLRDRDNIPCEDFIKWQEYVSRIFKMGSYAIKPFRKYINCKIEEVLYLDVREFSVYVSDMDIRTKKASEDNFIKYVVFEENTWSVCLGYNDLKPIILKYKYMEDNSGEINVQNIFNEALMNRDGQTGRWSRTGFLKQAEKEAIRSRRYGNIFSIAMFEIKPTQNDIFNAEYNRMCMVMASKIFSNKIRQTDILGRWSQNELIVLFTETSDKNAIIASIKLINELQSVADLDFEVSFGVALFDGYSAEDTILAAASDAHVRTYTLDGITTTQIFAYP